jgi:hypothetical protein
VSRKGGQRYDTPSHGQIDWDSHRTDALFEDLQFLADLGYGLRAALERIGRGCDRHAVDRLDHLVKRHGRTDLTDQLRLNEEQLKAGARP